MHPRSLPHSVDAATRAAWQSQLAVAKHHPGLWAVLVRERQDLLPRFASIYAQLRALPTRLRRLWQRRARASLAGAALALALGSGSAWADTITVSGTCSLIDAITTANTDTDTGGCVQTPATTAGADTIVLPANSVQTLTAVDNDTYGPIGLPMIVSEITIQGNNSTITRSGAAPAFRILALNASGNLTIQDTTISGGVATGRYPANVGGGIFNYLGQLQLEGCTVSGNTARYFGGGVYSRTYGSNTMTLSNSTISGNSAHYSGGGVSSRANDISVVTLSNSIISGNTAGYFGGGVYSRTNGTSTFTLTNSTLNGNSSGNAGGGVWSVIYGNSTFTLSNSTVNGNSAVNNGGGVYSAPTNTGTVTLSRALIADNTAGSFGGGVSIFTTVTGTATLTNSTVSGNSAGNAGGGVWSATTGYSTVTLTNSTLTDNTASEGGGMWNITETNSATTLSRALITGNIAPTGAEVRRGNSGGTFTANNYNLFGHNGLTNAQAFSGFTPGASDITATSDGSTPTALLAILDTTLADNGGPTKTHALVDGSPAVDASLDDADCEATDQRGVPRPQGVACDIGAFEEQAAVCGDGILGGGEACDLGAANGTPGVCCTATCSFVAAGTACRPPVGACDVTESCTADAFQPGTTACRAAAGACDVAESCTGSSADCPADAKSTAVCRAAAGVCDVAESCNGADNDCPADAFQPGTTVCRAAAGVCDVAESCTGTSAPCPPDSFQPATTVCRAATGQCDVAENCPGTGAACLANGFQPNRTTCEDGNPATSGETCHRGGCTGGVTPPVVLSPNGGEGWPLGSTQTIRWNPGGVSDQLNIELSRDNGATWVVLFHNTPNDGTQNWTVTGPATGQALVRVSSVKTPSIADTSNAVFTIGGGSVTVLAPNGSETWPIGSTQTIRWRSTGLSGKVKIELSRDGGTSWAVLFKNNVANTGNRPWKVKKLATTEARIRVSGVSDTSAVDTSNANFTIH
ncbi:MAG: hypothetical protein HY268_31795 [Deltaproteobacteria bacterium]|nr:hypothetical protein [Deltaproteobacteria bacterium]